VIEDLDFAGARSEGRERYGNRPSRGRRGRGFRRAVAGIPTARFRDRLVQMAANAGLHVIVSAGDRAARARPPGQAPRDGEPHRPSGGGTASPGATPDNPGGPTRTQEARHPARPPAATRHQDQKASPDHGRQPGSPGPSGTAG
jgi:hypothetical protein